MPPDAIVSFVPGPAHVRAETLAAMARPPLPHRGASFGELLAGVHRDLRTLLSTDAPVFPVLASSTTAVELALRALGGTRVLVLSAGAFGDRLIKLAEGLGREVEGLRLPPGLAPTADLVARALEVAPFDVVALTHCETQTGALADVVAIADVVRAAPGTALLVDAVSSLGGAPLRFDDLGPSAVLVSGTSKCLACPPGASLVAVGPEAEERAKRCDDDGYALRLARLVECARANATPNTPPTPVIYALAHQLSRIVTEGVEARWDRHAALAARVHAFAEERLAIVAPEGARSPTVTTIENTLGIDVDALLDDMERRGFRLGPGYGDLRHATFRIGHMGDVTLEETDAMLAALEDLLP